MDKSMSSYIQRMKTRNEYVGRVLEKNAAQINQTLVPSIEPGENAISSYNNISEGGSYILQIELDDILVTQPNSGLTKTLVTQSFTTTGSNTWVAPRGARSVTYLLVGGGGGGGGAFDNAGAGGGGGGLVLYGTHNVSQYVSYNVYVGDGGNGGTANRNLSPPEYDGDNGESSIFDTITASGGSGGNRSRSAPDGSGIGGSIANVTVAPGGGNGGGGGSGGGGGGGNSSAGSDKSTTTGGDGGSGIENSISGSNVTYGEGGRGGDSGTNNNGSASLDNVGEGGDAAGSASSNNENGQKGGSGIVILQYYEYVSSL